MASLLRVSSSGRWTVLQQLLIVILLQLEARPCGGYAGVTSDFCITHVDVENDKIEIEGNSTLQELSARFVGDRLQKFSVFSILHYVYLQPASESEQKYSEALIIHVCDDTDDGDEDCRAYNSTDVATTNIASTSTNYAALGPTTWDLLTLGFMDLTERANVSTIFLPLHPCPGRAEIVTTSILKLVRILVLYGKVCGQSTYPGAFSRGVRNGPIFGHCNVIFGHCTYRNVLLTLCAHSSARQQYHYF